MLAWSTPSPVSQRLRAVASRAAPSLLARGARAVAVTGSGGRGDAGAGSDLDLWLVCEDEGVEHTTLEGVPTMLMRESLERVLDLDHLAGVEVEITFVVLDPEGIFARAIALYRESAEQIRAQNLAGATARLQRYLESAERGTSEGRIWLLRQAAHLAASIRYLRDTGMMKPKMRHFRAHFGAEVGALLCEIQGIAHVEGRLEAVRDSSMMIADRINAELGTLLIDPPPAEPPENAILKLDNGEIDDGIIILRQHFGNSFIAPILEVAPGLSMVRYLLEGADPAIRSYWRRIHGFDREASELEALVARTRAAVDRLLTML